MVAHVGDELAGELAIGQALAPRAEVHLVDAHPAGVRVGRGPLLQPGVVTPRVGAVGDDRAGRGSRLGQACHGVGLVAQHVVGAAHGELVDAADGDVGDEELPHARLAEQPHRVGALVPAVEVADDVNGLGPGRPHREGHAGDLTHRAVVSARPRPEHGPQLLVAALADEVQVDLPEGGDEAVGVVADVLDAVLPGREDPVVHGARGVRPHAGEDAVALVREVDDDVVLEAHPHPGGQRATHPHAQPARLGCWPRTSWGWLLRPWVTAHRAPGRAESGTGVTSVPPGAVGRSRRSAGPARSAGCGPRRPPRRAPCRGRRR